MNIRKELSEMLYERFEAPRSFTEEERYLLKIAANIEKFKKQLVACTLHHNGRFLPKKVVFFHSENEYILDDATKAILLHRHDLKVRDEEVDHGKYDFRYFKTIVTFP